MRKVQAFVCRLLLILACGFGALTALVVTLRFTLLAVIIATAVFWRRLGRWSGSTSHGSARVCSVGEMEQNRMLDGEDGLILGVTGDSGPPARFEAVGGLLSPSVSSEVACRTFLRAVFPRRYRDPRLIRVKDACHLATISRSGGGKGRSAVVVTLLTHRGSVGVIDPKCENFNLTADFRRERFGHTIVRFDPMLIGGPGAASFNPLRFIQPDAPDFADQCLDLADMLIVPKGTEHDPHWDASSRVCCAGGIAFVCACEPNPQERNLVLVRDILSSPSRFDRAVATMLKVDNRTVRLFGEKLSWLIDKEKASVLSGVSRHIAWMSSDAIAACLSGDSIDPADLRRKKLSVYWVVPPERLVTWAPLVRLWLGSFLRLLMRDGASESNKVLFMLDEVAQLGRMQALEDAVCIGRGFGLSLWFILQSLKQVEACYGEKAPIFLDNIGTWQVFNLGNALETAEFCSRRSGDQTIRVLTPGTSDSHSVGTSTNQPGSSINRSSGSSINTAEIARKLFFPDEILRLPADVALIFHNNLPVIVARLLKYHTAEFERRCLKGGLRGLGFTSMLRASLILAASVWLAWTAITVRPPEPARPFAPVYVAPWQAVPATGAPWGQPAPLPGNGLYPSPEFVPMTPWPVPRPGFPPQQGAYRGR